MEDFRQQIWYKDYISYFETFPYKKNKHFESNYDWDLLLQLLAGSFSCWYEFEISKSILPRVRVFVEFGNSTTDRIIDKLESFQIDNLYKIFILEQMCMASA